MSWFNDEFLLRLKLKVFLSEKHLAVRQFLLDQRLRNGRTVVKRKLVTVFCSEDLSYLGLLGIICTELTRVTGAHVECYVSRELVVGESRSFSSFFLSRIIKRPFNILRWSVLYRSFCHSAELGVWIGRPLSDLTCLRKAFWAWRRATDKDSLVKMQIDGVLVGDLISDSYIRFKPFPTAQLSDWYLLFVIWQAYRSYCRAVRYFEKSHPKLFLTPYSSYIQNGIIVRVLLARGVSVYSFGEYQEFTKKLTQDDWFHTISPLGLKESFNGLDFKDEKLATAEEQLSVRFSGRKDAATAYMAKSAYGYEDVTVPDLTNATIVFLHDFFDSPNLYYDMVFPDFWEWVCFTIDVLDQSGRSYFLKPHPNQTKDSEMVIEFLKARYPATRFLPTSISNRQVVNGGIFQAITVYGSVANEMGYFGVPTVCCSRHPHASFSFSLTVKSRIEYRDALIRTTIPPFSKNVMKRESLEFYYMFNFGRGENERTLTDEIMKLRLACYQSATQLSVDSCFENILGCHRFREQIDDWASLLARGVED